MKYIKKFKGLEMHPLKSFRKNDTKDIYNKAHCMLCLFVWVYPCHIYGPILKPRVPMDSPWQGWQEKYKISKLKKKIPSLNASSPLECLFIPEGRAWAAGGGPEASFSNLYKAIWNWVALWFGKVLKLKVTKGEVIILIWLEMADDYRLF